MIDPATHYIKVKNMLGEATFNIQKTEYSGIEWPDVNVDGNMLCANKKFVAVSSNFIFDLFI